MTREPIGTSSLREAVKAAAAGVGEAGHIPRVGPLDPTVFRAFARGGVPFIIVGLVEHWPLAHLTPNKLREHFGAIRVKARHGDYVKDAFTPRRCVAEMSLAEYLDEMDAPGTGLPAYLGNQPLPQLHALCKWPPYYRHFGDTRTWLGPANTVTPLHCDYHENLFAQIWGRKRFVLYPPHHDRFLYTRQANPVLYASTFDPDAPDFESFPLALQAKPIECIVKRGDLLYLPAGWFHHVRALESSLSANRWAKDLPMVLRGCNESMHAS
jgi:hypothetical protein